MATLEHVTHSQDRLAPPVYLEHLAADSARLREVVATADLGAMIPSCPEWTVADLLWHLTTVQDFWAHVVERRPADPVDYVEPARPDAGEQLLEHSATASQRLLDALANADPNDEAWMWADEHTVAFILRRQTLEALVHRLDAEQAAGSVTALDPRLASDGVDEILDVFYGSCPEWADFSGLPHYLRLDCIDTDICVWMQLGRFSGTDPEDEVHHDRDGIAVVDDPGVEPDAVLGGTAEVLLARLWRRGDGAEIHLAGNLEIVDRFRAAVHGSID